MCFWQGVIQFESLARCRIRQQSRLPRGYAGPVTRDHVVGVAQPGISKSIVRIGGNGLLKRIDALLQPLWGASVPELPPFQIQPVGLRIRSPGATQSPLFLAGQLPSQMSGKVARDVALHLGNVGRLAHIMRAPKLSPVRS